MVATFPPQTLTSHSQQAAAERNQEPEVLLSTAVTGGHVCVQQEDQNRLGPTGGEDRCNWFPEHILVSASGLKEVSTKGLILIVWRNTLILQHQQQVDQAYRTRHNLR